MDETMLNNTTTRRRPYMAVVMSYIPEKNSQGKGVTNRREYTETVHFPDREPKGDLLYKSYVIIDVMNGKVIKNRSDIPDDDMFKHYIEKYKEKVQEACMAFTLQELSKLPREEVEAFKKQLEENNEINTD